MFFKNIGNNYLNKTPITQEIIARIDKMGLHQIKKLLHGKGNSYHSEEIAYRMGEKSLTAIHPTGG
jgi:hypothetical protein